jgi:RNA-directed DNA polymerase
LSFTGEEEAEGRAGMPGAHPKGSGRNPREYGSGASSAVTTKDNFLQRQTQLMERVVERANMAAAYKRVIANKGAPGIDKMTVEQLAKHLKARWPQVKEELLTGEYRPSPVRAVDIPKAGGRGVRTLGIPTVLDRLIQQALLQVLTPIFDPGFSDNSYGFRPGRSAHQAVLKAQEIITSGKRWVVDIDLEKFFDRVNHDILMSRVARKVNDKRVLRLIRRYLQAGMMVGGIVSARSEGTPQGGPLSPLLSNIMLDELDKELEKRGHAFVRYADDCNVYVNTKRSGERVMESVAAFVDKKLKLKVNKEKSMVDRPWKRSFLSYTFTSQRQPRLRIDPFAVGRLKAKIKVICRRGRGRRLRTVIEELTPLLRGWMNYFKLASAKELTADLDGWIRRKLRCILWRHWKRSYARARNLMRRGLTEERAWKSATNGRGSWWNSGASHMNEAFPKTFFDSLGLLSLSDQLNRLRIAT